MIYINYFGHGSTGYIEDCHGIGWEDAGNLYGNGTGSGRYDGDGYGIGDLDLDAELIDEEIFDLTILPRNIYK